MLFTALRTQTKRRKRKSYTDFKSNEQTTNSNSPALLLGSSLINAKELPWRRPMILGRFPTGIALASCMQPLIASEASPTLASRQQIETSLCLTHKLR